MIRTYALALTLICAGGLPATAQQSADTTTPQQSAADASPAPESAAEASTAPTVGDGKGTVTLRLPAVLPYALLEAAIASQLKPVEQAGLTFRTSNVSLSGGAGRLSAEMDADVSGKVKILVGTVDVDTKGTLEISGRPQVGSDGKSLALREMDAHVALNDETLTTIVNAAMPAIELALSRMVEVNLDDALSDVRKAVDARFGTLTPAPGVTFRFSDLDVTLLELTPRKEGLATEVEVTLSVAAEFAAPQ